MHGSYHFFIQTVSSQLVYGFTLRFFFASTSRRDRSSPRVGFAVRGSKTESEEDLGTGGFMAERGEDLRK